MDLCRGAVPIEGYSLKRLLGQGTFGEVWLAHAPGGLEVALKFAHLNDAGRVERSALDAMKGIRHAHLLTITAYWQLDQYLIIATEVADCSAAQRLQQVIQQEGHLSLPLDELLGYAIDVSSALDHLHQNNVVHCDVKPANILLVGSHAKVGDFGLLQLLEARATIHQAARAGTAPYMAPEVWNGEVSPRSDQYSLAVTWCELRTGRFPFVKTESDRWIDLHQSTTPDLSALSGSEQPVVAKALAKDRHHRWESCTAFVKALAEATSVLSSGSHASERLVGDGPVVAALTESDPLRAQAPDPASSTSGDLSPSFRLVCVGLILVVCGLGFTLLMNRKSGTKPSAARTGDRRKSNPSGSRSDALWHPEGLQAVLGNERFRHWAAVECVAWSPDGKWIASGGRDRLVCIWDARTSDLFQAFETPVINLAFSSNSGILATVSSVDGNVTLWNVKTGKRSTLVTGARKCYGVAFAPDDKHIAVSGDLTTDTPAGVLLWNINEAIPRLELKLKASPHFAFFQDNARIQLLHIVPQKRPDPHLILTYAVPPENEKPVSERRVEISSPGLHSTVFANGRFATINPSNNDIIFWEHVTGKVYKPRQVSIVQPGRPPQHSLTMSPRGSRLLSRRTGNLTIWDVQQRSQIAGRFSIPFRQPISCADFSPDENRLVVGDHCGVLTRWDVVSGKQTPSPASHSGAVSSVAISPDGKRVVSGCFLGWQMNLGTARGEGILWSTATRASERLFDNKGAVSAVAFSPDAKLFAMGYPREGSITIHDAQQGGIRQVLSTPPGVTALAIDPTGRFLVSVGFHKHNLTTKDWVRIHRLSGDEKGISIRGAPEPTPESPGPGFYSVAFAPDGKTFATGKYGLIRVWETETGQFWSEKRLHSLAYVKALSWSPDGSTLALGSVNTKSVFLLKLDQKNKLDQKKIPIEVKVDGVPLSMTYTRDGTQLVLGGRTEPGLPHRPGGVVLVLDSTTQRTVKKWVFPGEVKSVAVADAPGQIAVGQANGTVYLLKLPIPSTKDR